VLLLSRWGDGLLSSRGQPFLAEPKKSHAQFLLTVDVRWGGRESVHGGITIPRHPTTASGLRRSWVMMGDDHT
jgi:hypothetical protein